MASINKKTLIGNLGADPEIVVRGYLAVLGGAGVAVGWWVGSIALATCAGFLLGAYFSPLLPIWRAASDADRLRQTGRGNLKGHYWIIPVSTVALIGMALIAKLF